MKSSTFSLVATALWSLVRMALLLFFINSEVFPWGQLHSNLILVWFATPGVAGIILALQSFFEGPAKPRDFRLVFLLTILDGLVAIAVLVLGIVYIFVAGQGPVSSDQAGVLAWNVLVPAFSILVNGGLLVMLYNQAFKSSPEA